MHLATHIRYGYAVTNNYHDTVKNATTNGEMKKTDDGNYNTNIDRKSTDNDNSSNKSKRTRATSKRKSDAILGNAIINLGAVLSIDEMCSLLLL